MSHKLERQEKNCLNCGTIVQGRYCHHCGQENVAPKESFGSLVLHFVEDITHFDGKFFHSLKYILTRPGYLSKLYISGKRGAFLHPIRMYLFTSAVFFLIFFSFKAPESIIHINENDKGLTREKRIKFADRYKKELKERGSDTALANTIALLLDTTRNVKESEVRLEGTSLFLNTEERHYKTPTHYDSLQKTLPKGQRDGWIKGLRIKKGIQFRDKYGSDARKGLNDLSDIFLHNLPYMLFFSLPFFALILKLLYIRRKVFYYSDHAIFTIHHYIFSFILLLFLFAIDSLDKSLHWSIFKILTTLLIFLWGLYLYIGMKRFYEQGRLKTFVKFLLLNFLGSVVILLLFTLFGFLSLFQL